ncbi:MAG: hypothetical protein ACD_20C00317G0005 [uncultured bacterium]|nr:MAG: hypothetical protein ACD_20C00317G0005 [uncultured bacterium]
MKNYKKNKKLKRGMSLAEVFYTLTILAVVVTLTIPTLLMTMEDNNRKTLWKTGHRDIAKAAARLRSDQSGFLTGIFTNTDTMRSLFNNYFDAVQNCSSANTGICWHADNQWQSLSGTNRTTTGSASVLNNGMLVLYDSVNVTCTVSGNQCGTIYMDINGFKKPNTVGKDIFQVIIVNEDKMTYVPDSQTCESETGINSGITCSGKYLRE